MKDEMVLCPKADHYKSVAVCALRCPWKFNKKCSAFLAVPKKTVDDAVKKHEDFCENKKTTETHAMLTKGKTKIKKTEYLVSYIDGRLEVVYEDEIPHLKDYDAIRVVGDLYDAKPVGEDVPVVPEVGGGGEVPVEPPPKRRRRNAKAPKSTTAPAQEEKPDAVGAGPTNPDADTKPADEPTPPRKRRRKAVPVEPVGHSDAPSRPEEPAVQRWATPKNRPKPS